MRSINLHLQWGKEVKRNQLPQCTFAEVHALGNMLGCRPGGCYDIKILKSNIDFASHDGHLVFLFFVNDITRILAILDIKMFMRFIQGNIGIQDLLMSATYTDDASQTVVVNKEALVNAIIKQGLGGK